MFAAGWFLQGYCNGYYLLFFSVFVGLWVLWFASPWRRPRQFLAIGVAWLVAAIPVLPMLLRYRSIHASFGFARDFGTIRDFGADVASLLHAADHIALWGWIDVFRRPEGELFPGLTVTLLVIAGAIFVRDRRQTHVNHWTLARRVLIVLTIATALISASAVVVGPWRLEPFGIRLLSVANPIKPLTASLMLALVLALTSPALRRAYLTTSVIGFYAVAGFVMWLFSLGPAPTLMGNPFMYRGPYTLLMYLPGFNSLRVPARFWMTVTLCLAVIGAMVFARLTEKLGRLRLAAAAIVALGVLADTWMTAMPLAATPKPFAALVCGGTATGPIVELPLGRHVPGRGGDVPSDVAPPAARQRVQRLLPAALRGPALRVDAARSRRAVAARGARRHRHHRGSRIGFRRALGQVRGIAPACRAHLHRREAESVSSDAGGVRAVRRLPAARRSRSPSSARTSTRRR